MSADIAQSRHQFHALWLLIGLVLLTTIIYLSLTSKPPEVISFSGADKIGHLLAYAALMGWFGQLYTNRMQTAGLVIFFIILGVTLEFLQGMGGQRVFEYADMAANTLGVFIGLWLTRTWFAGFLMGVERKLGVQQG